MNKTQSLIIRILPQPLSIITRPYMTNIIHVEHKCDIETTMLEIWTLMYLYNDSEWHLPITLIWESEKSCRCALVAAFILTLFDVNLLESKFKNSRADFSTLNSAEFWTRYWSAWSVAKQRPILHTFHVEIIVNGLQALRDNICGMTVILYQMHKSFQTWCLKLVIEMIIQIILAVVFKDT